MNPEEAARLLQQDESSEKGTLPDVNHEIEYDRKTQNAYLGIKPLLFHFVLFLLYTSIVSWRFNRPVTDAECLQHMSFWCRSVP